MIIKLNKKLAIILIITIIICYMIYYLISRKSDIYSHTDLYPIIEPLKTYTIKVSDIHTVAYSTYGNINGKPVVYIHGGPGAGTTKDCARFFNPNAYYIVLVDQRGSGKSTPFGELKGNRTENLIEDFEKIRKSLQIKKWMLFGGSWGSTLSLAYAIKYPESVTEMILRGVFLSTQNERDWLFSGLNAANNFNPIGWKYFKNTLPTVKNDLSPRNYIVDYKKCFDGDFGEEKRDDCLISWTVWENSMSKLKPNPLEDVIEETKKTDVYVSSSLIENYYMLHHCFLEPGFFFRKKNIEKIRNIPTIIVQGRYDLICPQISAYKLHKELGNSKLFLTMAGHTAFDDDNIKYLVKATNSFIK